MGKELKRWRQDADWEKCMDIMYVELSSMLIVAALKSIPKKWTTNSKKPTLSKRVRELK